MIFLKILKRRAVAVLMAGTALFLFACQPQSTLPPKATTAGPDDAFAAAEKCRRQGELKEAVVHYRSFLKEGVKDDRSPLALQRIAEIELKLNNPEEALGALERLSNDYPHYNWIPEIEYQIAVIQNQLGQYETSAENAVYWLERYPEHFLRKDVLVLLGDDFCRLGREAGAFFCWIDARQSFGDDIQKKTELDEKLKTLIHTSGPVLLSDIFETRGSASYPSEIYYQISAAFLEQKEPKKAEEAARTLISSTRNLDWISKGKEILAQIKEETAICRNCIGCLLPLSGPFAAYGQEVLNGISLGMMRDPTAGGKRIEIVVRDTAGDPEKALEELESLAETNRVVGIVGPLSSKVSGFISAKAQDLGVPTIALTQRTDIVKTGDMVFRNFLTPAQEIDALLQLVGGELGIKRYGILYPDNTYGRFCMNLFWDKVDEMGGSVTAVESYPTDVTDFEAPIKKMVGLYYPRARDWRKRYAGDVVGGGEDGKTPSKEDAPIVDFDAVFIPDTYQRVVMIAPMLAFYDVRNVRLLGTRLWQSPQLVEMAGNYLRGAVFSSGFETASENPEVTAFVTDYQNNFGKNPGILAANGYDTICLLKAVLREYAPETREDLRQALLALPVFEGVTGPFRFNEEGEALKRPLLLTVSGRKTIPVY